MKEDSSRPNILSRLSAAFLNNTSNCLFEKCAATALFAFKSVSVEYKQVYANPVIVCQPP